MNVKYDIPNKGTLTAAALYMIITFILVRVFREADMRYLKHLNIGGGAKRKAPGRAVTGIAGVPQMR